MLADVKTVMSADAAPPTPPDVPSSSPSSARPRPSREWPELKSHVIDGLMRMMQEEQGTLRPPVQGAKLLTFIVHRYKAGLPFPPRKEVAERLGISIPTIDAAINARIAEGYLTVRYEFVEGNVKGRPSSMRERYLIPSQGVLDTFNELSRKRPRETRKKP